MKPTNAMAQLEQWKANHQQGKINQFVNEMNRTNNLASDGRVSANGVHPNETKNGLVKSAVKNLAALKIEETSKTQQETQGEAKSKYQGKLWANPLAFQFTQLTRQFKLILDSNQRCLEVYPDDFHHKLKMRDEMMDLIDRLKVGGKLFNALAKSQGGTFCRDNQATLKDFNQANGYLIYKFNEVVAQIERLNIERIEGEKLQGVGNE
ncbi:hypothetical protein BV154_003540 [Haemophilus influenzae]|uniref:hypothetical protein n=1 Tax=Haemophilus influenzae TaxID=727 RepID=UPI000CFFD516|nr:hypothetical protein [Haemophilus influenzae]PRI85967.1 hypothetical protein BV020_00571 [Haemophilus influenzae]PRI90537.1 hypothetical protein BV021_00760 [Haemophilus influenzae]PRJ85125.1 hypothetical protein BV154_01491 [Haemophilus influenzae]